MRMQKVKFRISVLKPFESLIEREEKKGVKTVVGSYTNTVDNIIDVLCLLGYDYQASQLYRLKNTIVHPCAKRKILDFVDYKHQQKTIGMLKDGFDFHIKVERC